MFKASPPGLQADHLPDRTYYQYYQCITSPQLPRVWLIQFTNKPRHGSVLSSAWAGQGQQLSPGLALRVQTWLCPSSRALGKPGHAVCGSTEPAGTHRQATLVTTQVLLEAMQTRPCLLPFPRRTWQLHSTSLSSISFSHRLSSCCWNRVSSVSSCPFSNKCTP